MKYHHVNIDRSLNANKPETKREIETTIPSKELVPLIFSVCCRFDRFDRQIIQTAILTKYLVPLTFSVGRSECFDR